MRDRGNHKAIACAFALLMALGWPVAARAASEPLAEVNGGAITAEEVEKALGPQLEKLNEEIYTLKRQKVEALIGERLLAGEAAKRGITLEALLDAEITSKVGLVTEQEIESFYQANRTQLRGDEASLRDQIRGYLQNQKLAARRETFVQSLRAQAQVVVHLKPPPPFRAQVNADGAPFKGSANALVSIVEFTDFHCPFCKRVQPTLAALLQKYGDKVKLVFRDFPIAPLHPEAPRAHVAARCADEQGKFWAYHDKLFAGPARSTSEQLKAYAQDVGLDMIAFEGCLDSQKQEAAVQRDIEMGSSLGVTGTPTFFINGRPLVGAQPLENFEQVIEDELARRK
jgi:protein-disulfide isomerase